MTHRASISTSRSVRRPALFGVSVVLAATVSILLLQVQGIPRQAAWMSGIFVLAALLWALEVLPLFATALLVFALEIVLLGNPGGFRGLGFESGKNPDLREFLAAAADPVLLLFLGGFILARAAVKEKVDVAMSSLLLRPFGGKPLWMLLGVILVTALFSMWMSNTACTAMMLTLVMPMVEQTRTGDRFRKALVLAVPFAASIGGIATPIGTPPNAVAMGFLRNEGHPIHFLDWMLVTTPLMILLLLFTWLVLWKLYVPSHTRLRFELRKVQLSGRGMFVVGIFTLTVLLWMTEKWHGFPAAVVALLPAVAFTITRILGREDIDRLEWNILILIAGGIVLGAGMQMTGLDALIGQFLASCTEGGGMWLMIVLVVGTIGISTFMSNTAAANLLLPIGISVAAAAGAGGPGILQITMSIALASSMDMILPVSTPPNAMAYGTGEVTTRDMAIPGILIELVGGILIIVAGGAVLKFWGL